MVKNKKKRRFNLSKVSLLHYIKLLYRSALFVALLVVYIIDKVNGTGVFSLDPKDPESLSRLLAAPSVYIVLGIVWVVYVVEMILRFIPSRLESPGCQKVFAKNYRPTGSRYPMVQRRRKTLYVFLVWCAINLPFYVFYVLYRSGVLPIVDDGIMMLLSLAYGICDMICILFFCPFQSWIMKNRCCSTCRIYNWDFIMMFTPMIPMIYSVFMPFAVSLFALALALFIVWEASVKRHPERFSDKTNKFIQCKNCTEKLCHHKKQLRCFLKKYKQKFFGDKK
jgi:hypothetical protein